MRLKLALPIFAATTLLAGAALAQASAPATPADAADAPISTVNPAAPPPPAPGQTPALLTAPPDSPLDAWLPDQGRDKKVHGEVSAGFDSRGGYFVSGEAHGQINDNTWFGISASQSKWRW
ncbi:MAG TPA: hypothetical protein VGL66_14335 [Caulobacteraceae bacterium]|jgi:hypothetical protein